MTNIIVEHNIKIFILLSSDCVPKFWVMTAFLPDAGNRGAMTPAAPDHHVHVVLLSVRRFLLHTTPETEHRNDYYLNDEIMTIFYQKLVLFYVAIGGGQ